MNRWSVWNGTWSRVATVVRQLLLVAGLWLLPVTAWAELQFDVFLGFDGITRELSWFPLVCEIRNDSAPVLATIEVEPVFQSAGDTRRLQVELPTGTLKRVTVPVFVPNRSSLEWNIRLRDSEGRVLAEHKEVRTRAQVSSRAVLVGSIARTSAGAPRLRRGRTDSPLANAAAEIQPSVFADHPLALQGMTSFYLNSQRAGELKPVQIEALMLWLRNGGRLVVAFESITDLDQAPWLANLVPCKLTAQTMLEHHSELQAWLQAPEWVAKDRQGKESNPFDELAKDEAFEKTPLPVSVAQVRSGATTLLQQEGVPLLVSIPHGKGEVLTLLANPEREPMKSWKNIDAFWSRLMNVPPQSYLEMGTEPVVWSSDSILGSLIETRQVQKMPLGWLMLLLIVYLAVIGPLDWILVRRLNRPMLTWLTFPSYVLGFSALIYVIGYKLRAGESELAQLHIIDVVSTGQGVELHGQTYASIYSPVNQDYLLMATNRTAVLRKEAHAGWRTGSSRERTQISQIGNGFAAKVQVPVWTSRLLVCEWTDSSSPAVSASLNRQGEVWNLRVVNQTDRPLEQLRMAVESRIYNLGNLGPKQVLSTNISISQGRTVFDFVNRYKPAFQKAAMYRGRHFGDQREETADRAGAATACSFLEQTSRAQQSDPFLSLSGLNLSTMAEPGGQAILFAWDPHGTRLPRLNQFEPARSSEETLWRQLLPINRASSQISKSEGPIPPSSF